MAVHGMSAARSWRGATANSSPGAARHAYDDVAVGSSARRAWTCGVRGEDRNGGSARAGHGAWTSEPKSASACRPSRVAARPVRDVDTMARSGCQRPKTIQTSTLRSRFSTNFPTEVDQVDNR
jgi:hypothetical protein